ncbi:MAG: hypothetical protein ACR2QK_05950 [Acidimicrobiales bacterium]
MTEDELDLLASAYLDGEATSEEVALVERDPGLLARVEQLRSVSGRLTASVPLPAAELKEQHLAAALAEFDGPTAAAPTVKLPQGEVVGEVVGATRRGTAGRDTERSGMPSSPPISLDSKREARKVRSLPQWLPAAAAFLLIGGGVVWLAGQTGSDDSETASVEAADEPTDGGADLAAEEVRAESEQSQAGDAAMDTAEATESAEAADEGEEEAMNDAAEDAADEDAADDGRAATTTTPAAQQAPAGGFFPDEPVMSFAQVPDTESILEDMPPTRLDVGQSNCGLGFEAPAGLEVVGFLPIEIEGERAELLVLVDGAGSESAVILDEACGQMQP